MQYSFEKKITALELAETLGLPVRGNKQQLISLISSLDNNTSNTLTFASKEQENSFKGIVIGLAGTSSDTLIISQNPRLDFCRAIQYLLEQKCIAINIATSNIHDTAIIAPSAIIEDNVSIGMNTCIEHNVTVHNGTIIGDNCIIRANTVIGAQGFGFEKSNSGEWVRFPHLGRVVIGNNVEIGALNSVCVGTLDNTIIGDGVKTDNLVHIAHNCHVGKNSILTACAELSGGVKLGEGVWMGPNSSTMQKIKIEDHAIIGLGSVVTKNVKKGHVVAGVPAKIIKRG